MPTKREGFSFYTFVPNDAQSVCIPPIESLRYFQSFSLPHEPLFYVNSVNNWQAFEMLMKDQVSQAETKGVKESMQGNLFFSVKIINGMEVVS